MKAVLIDLKRQVRSVFQDEDIIRTVELYREDYEVSSNVAMENLKYQPVYSYKYKLYRRVRIKDANSVETYFINMEDWEHAIPLIRHCIDSELQPLIKEIYELKEKKDITEAKLNEMSNKWYVKLANKFKPQHGKSTEEGRQK